MTEKKELNIDELEKVSGGSGHASADNLPEDHGEHITADKAKDHKHEEVYFVLDSYDYCYGYGTLINSDFNDKYGCITHDIFVKYLRGAVASYIKVGSNADIKSSGWTLYKKNSL